MTQETRFWNANPQDAFQVTSETLKNAHQVTDGTLNVTGKTKVDKSKRIKPADRSSAAFESPRLVTDSVASYGEWSKKVADSMQRTVQFQASRVDRTTAIGRGNFDDGEFIDFKLNKGRHPGYGTGRR